MKLLICFSCSLSHFPLAQFRLFPLIASCHLSWQPLTRHSRFIRTSMRSRSPGLHWRHWHRIDHCQIVYTFGPENVSLFLAPFLWHSKLKKNVWNTGLWKSGPAVVRLQNVSAIRPSLGRAEMLTPVKMAKLNGLISDDMSIIVNNGKKDLLKREKSREEKGNWGNKWEFLFSGLSYAVGLGNVWRYAERSRKITVIFFNLKSTLKFILAFSSDQVSLSCVSKRRWWVCCLGAFPREDI